MPRKDLPFRVHRRPDRLRHADDDAPGQRSPQTAQTPDDDRLEGIDQAGRADGGIKVRPHPQVQRGDGDGDHGQPGRHGEHAFGVYAHEAGGDRVVTGRAEGAAKGGAVEDLVQDQDHPHCRGKGQKRHPPQRHHPQIDRGTFQRPRPQPLAVGREGLEQTVLQCDRQPERDQQGRQDIAPQHPVQDMALQQPAEAEHHRGRDQRGKKGMQTGDAADQQDAEGREHDQIAMGQIDQPHDAEDQAETCREQRVKAAQQDALHDRIKPDHAAAPGPTPRGPAPAPPGYLGKDERQIQTLSLIFAEVPRGCGGWPPLLPSPLMLRLRNRRCGSSRASDLLRDRPA